MVHFNPEYINIMISYIKGGIQAKGIWKQDTEANGKF